jgi:hypothetical protein
MKEEYQERKDESMGHVLVIGRQGRRPQVHKSVHGTLEDCLHKCMLLSADKHRGQKTLVMQHSVAMDAAAVLPPGPISSPTIDMHDGIIESLTGRTCIHLHQVLGAIDAKTGQQT